MSQENHMTDKINSAQENLIQVIIANTSSAIKISNILLEHSEADEDKIMKADEIICGLVYRLMIPMQDQEIKDSMSEAESIMYDSSDDDDDDDDDDKEIIDDLDDFKGKKKVRTNNCNCDICQEVRVCLLNFNDYVPKDELGDKFKSSIIETCQKYNKII